MNSVPQVQTQDRNVNQLQSNVIPPLNSLLAVPIVNGNLLTGVALIDGTTTINTNLNRALIGWIPVRWHGAWAEVYDTQDSNKNPNQTLVLVSNAAVTVDLWVF